MYKGCDVNLEHIIRSLYEAIPEAFTKVKEFPKRPKYLSLDELEVYKLELPVHDKPLWRLSKIVKPLSEKDYEKIDKRVREYGMEALAWYRPFHYLPKELWGIYITLDGLKYLVQKLRHSIRLSVATAIWYAVEILWQHELFHFIVEVFSTRVEFITREPKYLPYLRQFYEATWPNCLEEALANRHVLRRRNLNKAKRFLYAFFDQQPGWYREYRRFLTPDKFREGRIELCNQIVFSSHLHLPINELRPPARFNVRNIPTFIVAEWRLPEVSNILSLIVKPQRLIRFLKRRGFEVVRQRGSHVVLKNADGKTLVLSIHGDREVHPKTLKDVQAAIGISRDELLKGL